MVNPTEKVFWNWGWSQLCQKWTFARKYWQEGHSMQKMTEEGQGWKTGSSCTNHDPRNVFFLKDLLWILFSWTSSCTFMKKRCAQILVFWRVPTAEVLAVGFDPRMSSCLGSRHSLRKLSSSTWPEGGYGTQVKLARKIGCHKLWQELRNMLHIEQVADNIESLTLEWSSTSPLCIFFESKGSVNFTSCGQGILHWRAQLEKSVPIFTSCPPATGALSGGRGWQQLCHALPPLQICFLRTALCYNCQLASNVCRLLRSI